MVSLEGKKALIMGVANQRSIAYGIAQALKQAGAQLAFTYIPPVEKRMRPLAEELDSQFTVECDVGSDEQVAKLMDPVEKYFDGKLDILIHSLAYAEKEDLEKDFVQTSRTGFQKALDISAFSLIACCRALLPALEKAEGSVTSLTYYGAERVIPNYNVMGVAKAALEANVRYLAWDLGKKSVRVNAISAGPIRTLAASGVKDFRSILNTIEEKAPLHRNVTTENVGQTACFLSSEAAQGITGEVLHVDSGFNIMGL